MIYVRVASGYRPGGPNVALPGFPATVGSERVTSYEAGIKASFLDRAVTFDAATFLLDWDDLQTSAPFAGGINGLVNEIGRASCRERVCQSVSISVVDVSLKKTQRTQIQLDQTTTHKIETETL